MSAKSRHSNRSPSRGEKSGANKETAELASSHRAGHDPDLSPHEHHRITKGPFKYGEPHAVPRDQSPDLRSASQYVCSLDIQFPSERGHGTGFFIGPRTIVTAGHCLLSETSKERATSVTVYPGQEGPNSLFHSTVATKFFVSRGWADTQAREADYGAIVLAAPGYPAAGCFGLRICTDDELKNAEATILGYPLEPVRGENCDGMHQYVARGRLETILPRLLAYRISTRAGQSGSPISIFIGPKRYVVGIHTLELEKNAGVRITAEVKQDLLLWLSHA